MTIAARVVGIGEVAKLGARSACDGRRRGGGAVGRLCKAVDDATPAAVAAALGATFGLCCCCAGVAARLWHRRRRRGSEDERTRMVEAETELT